MNASHQFDIVAPLVAAIPTLALPPLATTWFLVPLLLQCLLLHPRFPELYSRPLRLLLVIPGVYLSLRLGWDWRVEPVADSIAVNFRWGIFGPFFAMRSLEYGFARDRTAYRWIGFENVKTRDSDAKVTVVQQAVFEAGAGTATRNGSLSKMIVADVAEAGKAQVVKRKEQRRAAKEDEWGSVLAATFHLFTSLRGNGYGFGSPRSSAPPTRPLTTLAFFKSACRTFLSSHLLSTLCVIIIVTQDTRRQYIASVLDLAALNIPSTAAGGAEYFAAANLPQPLYLARVFFILSSLSNCASYIAVGVSLYAQMKIGLAFCSLLFYIGTVILRAILPAHSAFRPIAFNPLEWPDLFHAPTRMSSVTSFWGKNWHELFRKSFLAAGYVPVAAFFTKLGMRELGKVVGVYVVFALSAAMHHLALLSATWKLDMDELPFFTYWAGPIFFLSQATAVMLESTFTKLTGRRVSGTYGRIWSYAIVVGLGMYAAHSWLAMGFARGLPPLESWSWQRFVIPNAALLPASLFTRPPITI